MADDKQKNADFIEHVVGDAKNPQETRMLTGWFGESGEEGHRRLYTDAELSNYIDIPDDAILHSEPLKDVQPSGGVIVWINRDAALKQGGSASSRAARFLQGQVQQDFASAGAAGSLEKAGLRCATQVPCGEPTGFTGECTNQPEVGGAWPCITAIPLCFEVTGFTGKCTPAPWPNPTRYIGCTQLHCPTHDLTHIPHICNIVASGNPGCVVINPPQEGDPAQKVGAEAEAEAKPLPATEIPGCGYTKSWGVCETHLLGCGYTKDWGNQCPTQLPDCPTAAPGCGWSRNPICTDLPGCNWTKQPAICHQTVSQGMVPCTGPLPVDDVAAQRGAVAQPASIICATAIGCDITLLCHTRFQVQCFHSLVCVTQPQQCFPIPSPFCPVTQACPFGPGGGGDPAQHFAAFGAAAPRAAFVPNTDTPCSAVDTCPSRPCFTQPPTALCTQIPQANCPTLSPDLCPCTTPPENCPTGCGVNCQTPQPNCTQCNCPTVNGPPCPTPQLDCTFGCTQVGTGCPGSPVPNCIVITKPNAGAQAFAARAVGPQPLPLSQVGCPASDFVACSQFGGCQTIPNGDCTFFGGCPSLPQQFAAAGPGGGCTQSGPMCPTHARPQCTFAGPACPPTPATICTQFAPCPTHHQPCHTPGFECTMFCTQGAPGCPHTIQNAACPITVSGPQCPVHSGFNCPSAIACQSIACQPGGGGEQQAFAARPAGGAQFGISFPHPCSQHVNCLQPPTAVCLHATPKVGTAVCPSEFAGCTQIGLQCPTEFVGCTQFGPHCPTFFHCPHTAATVCTLIAPECPPRTTHGPACPTIGGPFCLPGGGGEQQAFAAAQPQAGGGIHPTIWTQIGPQCPPHLTGGIDCTVVFCTHAGPHCPPTPATVCTQSGPQCHTHLHPICPTGGVDCTVVLCTHVGPWCPPNTHPTQCPAPTPLCLTVVGPHCPPHTIQGPACPVLTAGGPQCPPASGFNCPSVAGCQSIACGQSLACQPGGGQQEFAAQRIGPTGFLGCTQSGPHCPTYPNGDCTFFGPGCPSRPQFALAGPGAGCTQSGPQCPTQSGPQCPTRGQPQCTLAAPACPPTHVIGCTQSGPQCHTQPIGHCTVLGCPTTIRAAAFGQVAVCTQIAPQFGAQEPFAQHAQMAPGTFATVCTQFPPQCPHTEADVCAPIRPQQGTAFPRCHPLLTGFLMNCPPPPLPPTFFPCTIFQFCQPLSFPPQCRFTQAECSTRFCQTTEPWCFQIGW
jgi:hypothetical protein